MKTPWRFSATLPPLLIFVLLAGCLGVDQEFGASRKKMYADQLTINVVLPANAPSISQNFWRFPKTNAGQEQREEHLGIDITAKKGTPILAPAPGRVAKSYFEPMFGHTIEIDHGTDSTGRRIRTLYKHMSARLAQSGDVVVRGQRIGALGKTGILSAGILHLHFEVLREGQDGRVVPVDPSAFWMNGVGRATCFTHSKNWPDTPFKITYPVQCRGN